MEKSETFFFAGGRSMAPDPLRARTRGTGPSLAFYTNGVKGYYNRVQPPPPPFEKFLDPPLRVIFVKSYHLITFSWVTASPVLKNENMACHFIKININKQQAYQTKTQ